MNAPNPLLEIPQYGQSIWMDNLSRNLIVSGGGQGIYFQLARPEP